MDRFDKILWEDLSPESFVLFPCSLFRRAQTDFEARELRHLPKKQELVEIG